MQYKVQVIRSEDFSVPIEASSEIEAQRKVAELLINNKPEELGSIMNVDVTVEQAQVLNA